VVEVISDVLWNVLSPSSRGLNLIYHNTKALSFALNMESVFSSEMSEQFFITWLGTWNRHSLEFTTFGFNVLVPILYKCLFFNLGLVNGNQFTISTYYNTLGPLLCHLHLSTWLDLGLDLICRLQDSGRWINRKYIIANVYLFNIYIPGPVRRRVYLF